MKTKHRDDKNIGTISISRTSGGSSNRFVGSTVPSDTAIRIQIRQAEKYSDEFNKERFNSRANIVEVEMTPNQWAELITTLNYGMGTPCTITRVGNEEIPQTYETESVFEYYNDKLQDKFLDARSELKENFKDAKDILDNKKSITKSDRATILHAYSRVERFFGDSAPFMQKLFKEDIQKHTVDAAIAFKHDMDSIIKSLSKEQLKNIENMENVTSEKLGLMLLEKARNEE